MVSLRIRLSAKATSSGMRGADILHESANIGDKICDQQIAKYRNPKWQPTKSEWQAAYLAAMVELDDASLAGRIHNAEDAICRRLQSDRKLDVEDGQALFDAIHGLHVLRTERLRDRSENGRIS